MNFGDLNRDDWVAILTYGGIGLFLAQAIPGLFRGRLLRGLMSMVFWAVVFAGSLVVYAYRFDLQGVGQRVLAVAFPGTPLVGADRSVTVFRQRDGQFAVTATVGSSRLPFILDTGASTVVLKAEDAARAGVQLRRLAYDIPVATANGHALTAAVVLPRLTVGPIVETDVDALVAKPGALHVNLLGMSFLNRLASVTFRNDRLELRGE